MKKIIIPAMFVLVLFFSCKNENPNKTIQLPLDSIEIVTDTMSIDFKCLCYSNPVIDSMYLDEYLIRNENEYDSLLRNKCKKYTLQNIDFNKFILAGYKTVNGDSNTKVIKKVTKDNLNKICYYHLDIYTDHERFGYETAAFRYMNWLLIPKLSGEWKYQIDTTTIFIQ